MLNYYSSVKFTNFHISDHESGETDHCLSLMHSIISVCMLIMTLYHNYSKDSENQVSKNGGRFMLLVFITFRS